MEENLGEKFLDDYSLPFLYTQKMSIKQQLDCICRIFINAKKALGFFCKINYNNSKETLPVLITNNSTLNENDIKPNKNIKVSFYENEKIEYKVIKIGKKILVYTNEKYDTTIIEINKEKDEINNYLELDSDLFRLDSNGFYFGKPIYILNYPEKKSPLVSYGIIEKEENMKSYEIIHNCCSEKNNFGGPILSLREQKVLGINNGGKKSKSNKGCFLKYPIRDFISLIINKKKIIKKNEIEMEIQINEKDKNQKIHFLDNTKDNKYLKELNQSNVELFINEKKFVYQKFFYPEKEGIYSIKLKLSIDIKDCSYMFASCENLIYINLSSFNTKKVTNMAYMFSECHNLNSIDLFLFDTKNVNSMEGMFYNCEILTAIYLSFLDTKQVNNSILLEITLLNRLLYNILVIKYLKHKIKIIPIKIMENKENLS